MRTSLITLLEKKGPVKKRKIKQLYFERNITTHNSHKTQELLPEVFA